MLSLELVIFDCDGVLVDSEVISNRVLARRLTEIGLPRTLAQTRREYQGLRLDEVVTRSEQSLGRPLPADFLERFVNERAEEFRRELKPVPGAEDMVRRVKAAGVGVCVASQGRVEKTRMTLGLTGLDQMFEHDAVFSAYSVARGKPFPDLFLHAAQAMGAQPGACAVIEDTPSGVTAAVRAGMRVLGYSADSDEPALRAAGAEIVHSLHEVPVMLGISA